MNVFAGRVPTGLVRIVVGGVTAGTGFVVSDDGLIATCAHVVGDVGAEGEASLVFGFGERADELRQAQVVESLTRAVEAEDVAFLRVAGGLPDGVGAVVLGSSAGALGATFSTFGYPEAKPVEGMAGELQVTGSTSEGGAPVLQVRSNEVSRGFSGAPAWDERGVVVGMVTSVVRPDELGRHGEVSFVRPVEVLIDACPQLRPRVPSPYRGLEVFEEEHADAYFGRDRAGSQLLEMLCAHDFVAVVGVSGSGKSSLVRAGLRKSLERDPVPQLVERPRCVVVPGSAPTLDLVLALERVLGSANVTSGFGLRAGALDDPDAPLRDVGDALGRLAPEKVAEALAGLLPGGLVVVDQFERVFTEAGGAVGERFVDVLVAACGLGVKVVVTLRADFYGLALTCPGLATSLGAARLTLAPMSDNEFVAVIEEPARLRGRRFEAGLVERLVGDVRGRPGDLPLLEFALEQLWARDADGGVLREATYESLGYEGPDGQVFPGVQGAIAKRAEQVWDALSAPEHVAARRVFLSVVAAAATGGHREGAPEMASSRRAWLMELGEDERAVAEKLTAARLLTLGRDSYSGQATIEVAHEALIRAWPLLGQWAESFRPFMRWRDRELDGLWRSWVAHDEDPQLLLPFGMLDEARRWMADYEAELSASHVHYIQASVQAFEAHAAVREAEIARTTRLNRRLRALAWGLGAFVMIALVATILAVSQTDKTRQQARVGTSRLLSFEAEARAQSDPSLSVLLSLAAANSADTTEARRSLQSQLIRQRHVRRILTAPSGAITTLAYSPDGRLLAAGGPRATSIWDLRASGPPRTLPRPRGSVTAISFSRDNHLLAAGGARGIAVYDLTKSSAPHLRYSSTERVTSLAITQDARTLVFAAATATITIHQLATGQRATITIPDATRVDEILTTPDNHHAIVLTDNGATTYDLTTHEQEHRYPVTQPTEGDLALTADGRTLAVNGGLTTDLVETSTATKFDSLGLGDGGNRPVTFRPDGRIMAATNRGDDDGEIEIVTFPLGAKGFSNHDILHERRVVGRRRDVSSLAYSPDGRTLASGSADGTVTLWDPASRDTITAPRLADIQAIAFDSSGQTLALGGTARAGSATTYALSFFDVARRRTILHQPCARYAAPRPRTSIWALSGDGCGLGVIDLSRRKGHRLVRLVRPRREYRRRFLSDGTHFSPDGRLLAERVSPYRPLGAGNSTIFEKELLVWDLKSPRPVATFKVGLPETPFSTAASTQSFAFSPDGRTLAIGRSYDQPASDLDDDVRILLWDTRRRRTKATIKLDGPMTSLAFDPSGETLAVGLTGSVELWRLADRKRVTVIRDVRDEARQLAFTPDAKTLLVSDRDGVQLWSLQPLSPGVRLPGNHESSDFGLGFAFALSPDGRTLAVADNSEAVVLWNLDSKTWHRQLCAIIDRDLTRSERERFLPSYQRSEPTCPEG